MQAERTKGIAEQRTEQIRRAMGSITANRGKKIYLQPPRRAYPSSSRVDNTASCIFARHSSCLLGPVLSPLQGVD
jgi:hypothetical protein